MQSLTAPGETMRRLEQQEKLRSDVEPTPPIRPRPTESSGSSEDVDFDSNAAIENSDPSYLVSITQHLSGQAYTFDKFKRDNDATRLASTNSGSPMNVQSPSSASLPRLQSTLKSASTHRHQVDPETLLQLYLCEVPHFSTLSFDELKTLHPMVREYAALDLVCDYGNNLNHVYVVATGSVEVFNPSKSQQGAANGQSAIGHKRAGTITAPNIFGLDAIIFNRPSQFVMRAGGDHTTLFLIKKDEFMPLIQKSTTFARSIGRRLIQSIPGFSVFSEFCRSIFSVSSAVDRQQMSEGYTLSIPDILVSYLKINSLIHPLAGSGAIDYKPWGYALNRLPSNITETFVLNLARSLPPFLAHEIRDSETMSPYKEFRDNMSFASPNSSAIVPVETKERRRSSWKVGHRGNTLVLVREGFTDVIDLVTCFCVHLVESRKLRMRLQAMVAPTALEVLRNGLRNINKLLDHRVSVDPAVVETLSQLPLTKEEQAGLIEMWPENTLQQIYNIIMHRDEVVVKIDTSISKRFDVDPYVTWALSLRSHLLMALGRRDTDELPDDIVIDILSSNSHSTKNLLCSMAINHKDELIAWAKINHPSVLNENWNNENDMLFYLWGAYLPSNDKLQQAYRQELHKSGFVIMEETSMTGLQVDVIDISKLRSDLVDPALRPHVEKIHHSTPQKKRHFILNMNFAFGAQTDGIVRALVLTFGTRIQSINVVGKAACLNGKRGDVQLPNALVFSKAPLGEDSTDEIRNVNPDADKIAERLQAALPDRKIHRGAVLTSAGVLLQNALILKYYKAIYNCIGVEMEGSYFARQVEESINLELVRSDIQSRYVYYTHDCPMDSDHEYRSLRAYEGVPPLYAIVRLMVEQMLQPVRG